MREIPKPLEQYMHFKGKRYQIIAIAKHSETMEQMVVYQALYGDYGIYVRPLDMFLSEVDHQKYPDVKQTYRFARIGVDKLETVDGKIASGDVLSERIQTKEIQPKEIQPKEVLTHEDVTSMEVRNDEAAVVDSPNGRQIVETDGVETEEEPGLDPLLLEFLDANTTEDRLNILTGLHSRITHEMINTIAVVLDLNVPDGDIEDRYAQVKYALFTKKKYEGTRLR